MKNLKCEREKNNTKDPYDVAVVRKNVSVDLPQEGLEIPFVNFRCLINFVC